MVIHSSIKLIEEVLDRWNGKVSIRNRIISSFNYLLKMKAHTSHKNCWRNCFRWRVIHSPIKLIEEILARWSMFFCKNSKLNFGSLVCFKEFLIVDSPKRKNIFKTLYTIPIPSWRAFFVKIEWFVDLSCYSLYAPRRGIFHRYIALHGGYLQLFYYIFCNEI